jgi:O-antigen/teichoic acid export membrane protein
MLQDGILSTNTPSKISSTGLSLRANFSWTFFGNTLYAATQWGLLTLLTKLFEPDQFGRYSLAFSTVTPIFVASAMQLRAVYVSDVERQGHDESRFATYLALRLTTNLLGLVCVALLAALGVIPVHLFSLALLLSCNQAVVLVADMYQGIMQKQERMDLLAISSVIQGVASLTAAVTVAFVTHSMILVVLGMFIARSLVLFLYQIPQAQAAQREIGAVRSVPLVTRADLLQAMSISRLWPLARTALPLSAVALLINLHLHVPRYFLADFGEDAVGYFAAIASLAAMPDLVIAALGQSAVRQLAVRYASDRKAYLILVGRLLAVGAVLGLIGVAAAKMLGRPVLALLFRPEYARSANVFVWLMVARMALNIQSFLGYAMTAARWFKLQVWTYGLMLVSLFAAAWFLIPRWGSLGAAWATLVSACTTLAATLGIGIYRLRKEDQG